MPPLSLSSSTSTPIPPPPPPPPPSPPPAIHPRSYTITRWSQQADGLHLVDLATLSVQQLSQVKKQLDDEVQHLTGSYSQLRTAQQKFRDCITSIQTGVANSTADKPLLVPLTSSLYVPGTLASTETVVVDVGTGFYVEKTTAQAKTFYEAKVDELGKNVKDLEVIVNTKAQNLRLVEEGMLITPLPYYCSTLCWSCY